MHRIVDFRRSADRPDGVYENNPSPCEYYPKVDYVEKDHTSRNYVYFK